MLTITYLIRQKKVDKKFFPMNLCHVIHKVDDLFYNHISYSSTDYANSRCQSYDLDANSRSGRKRLEKDSIVNFFEKVCLRGGK